jgi:hypothetical protein
MAGIRDRKPEGLETGISDGIGDILAAGQRGDHEVEPGVEVLRGHRRSAEQGNYLPTGSLHVLIEIEGRV